jgi:hypothetical protein
MFCVAMLAHGFFVLRELRLGWSWARLRSVLATGCLTAVLVAIGHYELRRGLDADTIARGKFLPVRVCAVHDRSGGAVVQFVADQLVRPSSPNAFVVWTLFFAGLAGTDRWIVEYAQL